VPATIALVRVLGVDPGLTRCGLGVVDSAPGRRVRLVAVGVTRSDPALDVDQRLLTIAETIDQWLEEHAPDTLAVEQVFAQHNVRTVMGTAQVSGIAMLAAARRRIPPGHLPPVGSDWGTRCPQCEHDKLTSAQRTWTTAEQAARPRPAQR